MKVAFLGNHTVGVTTLATIARSDDIAGVVAHPIDPEDGVRYESVFDFAQAKGWPAIRGKGGDQLVADFLYDAAPDLLWVADYRYLLPPKVLTLAKFGAINLHPSLLPKYRGRAPVNWAILEGETRLGLTAHFITPGMDSGDVIAQVSYDLGEDEDVGDALSKLYPLYESVTQKVLRSFRSGRVNRVAQDESSAFSRSARRPDDGLIDWHKPAEQVCNLVRAVAAPYPGAFTYCDGTRLTIWRATRTPHQFYDGAPGQVIGLDSEGSPIVMCSDAAIVLKKTDFHRQINHGEILGMLT